VVADNPWEDEENAQRYGQFADEYALYRRTSQDLAGLARLARNARVVDLACGTGATTKALLAVLGPHGRVVAVDSSRAMLGRAKAFIGDHRVRWLRAPAEQLGNCGIDAVDAVVCNSAIWQTNMPATVAAVGRVLRPAGRFVFNVGARMLADHPDADQPPAPLIEMMEAIAARDHGWAASPAAAGAREPGWLSERSLRNLLGDNGFRVEQVQEFQYRSSLDDQRAWLSVPIFTVRRFGGLSYPQRMAILSEAYRHLAAGNGGGAITVRWVAFTARRRPVRSGDSTARSDKRMVFALADRHCVQAADSANSTAP
jgi:SAM-dependent methyltransferase